MASVSPTLGSEGQKVTRDTAHGARGKAHGQRGSFNEFYAADTLVNLQNGYRFHLD